MSGMVCRAPQFCGKSSSSALLVCDLSESVAANISLRCILASGAKWNTKERIWAVFALTFRISGRANYRNICSRVQKLQPTWTGKTAISLVMSFTVPEWVALVTGAPPLIHPTIKELSQFRQLDCLWEIHYTFESPAEFIGHKFNTFEEFAEWGPARMLLIICFKEATSVPLKTSRLALQSRAAVCKLKNWLSMQLTLIIGVLMSLSGCE